MTEPQEPTVVPAETTPPPTVATRRPERLYRIAAWVAIAAGSLVIVAVVFGSGFFLGTQVGDSHDRGRGGEHSEIFDAKPGEPPFGRMERRPGPDQQFPNFPGLPQPPEGATETPTRPSALPTP